MQIPPKNSELPRLFMSPSQFFRKYWAWLLILLIGAAADAITTYRNLHLYGIGTEAHPVQRWVSQILGVGLGVPVAKLIQLAFVLFVAAWWKPWTPWLLGICGLLYIAAAVSNFFLLL